MASHGMRLLAALIASEEGKAEFVNMDLRGEFFDGDESDVFDMVSMHLSSHGTLPSIGTVEEETGHGLPEEVPEPPTFYLKKLIDRYVYRTLKAAVEEAKVPLNNGEVDIGLHILEEAIYGLGLVRQRKNLKNIVETMKSDIHLDYMFKAKGETGIHLGWPYLDEMTNGLVPGDMMSLVGRPGTGKSYFMLWMTQHAWREQHKTPLVVSMEMSSLVIQQRVAAMHLKVPVKKLMMGALTTKTYKGKVKNALDLLPDSGLPPYWLIDGNLAVGVNDIVLQCRNLKPDVVYVDGAYMLRTQGRSRWERIAETCEDLKRRVAGGLGIPVVASYQFNREASKVKKKDDIGLEHIAGADEITKISSVVLGLVDTKGVEGMTTQTIRVLKGRNGEEGQFRVNWIFDKHPFMDFSEIVEEKVEDLHWGDEEGKG